MELAEGQTIYWCGQRRVKGTVEEIADIGHGRGMHALIYWGEDDDGPLYGQFPVDDPRLCAAPTLLGHRYTAG